MISCQDQTERYNTNAGTRKHPFCKITVKELLALFIGTALPVAIGIYTAVTNEQMQKAADLAADKQQRIADERRAFDLKQATEVYQQQLYKNFLDAMYALHKDGELNDSANPWVFANARYRASHREFDTIRKAQALQFLKERELIGRHCITGCEQRNVTDIIRLNSLNFDDLILNSQVGNLNRLDLSCVHFDQVSMTNAVLSYINLNGVVFTNSHLNGTTFVHSSLNCTKFIKTELRGTKFSNSELYDAYLPITTPMSPQEQYTSLANEIPMTSKTTATPITTESNQRIFSML